MRKSNRLALALLAALALALPGHDAPAQQPACQSGRCPVANHVPGYQPAPRYTYPVYTVAAPAPAATAGSLLAHVNQARARRGLAPFAADGGLEAHAQANNSAQARSGLGHHVSAPGAWQCASSTADPAAAVRSWERSPAHAAILFGNHRTAGLACSSGFSTLNCR